jgi:hypothetical protein
MLLVLVCDWSWDKSQPGNVYNITLNSIPLPTVGMQPTEPLHICIRAAPDPTTERKIAVCVRPFRPFFFNKPTERSIRDDQVGHWQYQDL